MTNLITQQQTMSSLDIAELLGSQHGNVRISIERLAKKGVIQLPSLQLVNNNQSLSANNKTNAYIFSGEQGKRDSIIVVAQLSPEFTALIVDRWKELEDKLSKPQLPNFNDPVESARAWADAKESEIKALALIEEQKPKAQYYDAVAKNEHHMNATQLAQKFNLGVVTFNKHLLDLGIYNKNIVKPKTFKQDFVNKGFGRMTTTTNGFSQAVFTTKGEQYLHELLVGEGII